jgi:perosamine synthetase
VGAFVDRFESSLAEFTGANHAVAVVNGTAALHLSLLLAGVRPGDEVVVPALTFVATANAVSYCGATPHFADCEETSLGVDAAKLADHLSGVAGVEHGECRNRRTGRPIRALVVVHVFGHPADLDPLREVCDRFRIAMVEDAAESVGSYYKGAHTGTRGIVSALSFNGNKILTTGGGGAILTNDERIAREAKHLSTTSRVSHAWEIHHDAVGFNYRLPNLNAALGVAQLERLPTFLDRKRALALRYQSALADIPGVRFLAEPRYARSNYWLNTLILVAGGSGLRDEILALAHGAGILARPCWRPMHHLPMYRGCPRMDLSCAEVLENSVISLPSGVALEVAGGR